MYPISPQLAAALSGPGVAQSKAWCELWQAGHRVATSEIVSGTVTADRSAAVRRSCSLVLPSLDGLLPDSYPVGNDRKFGDGTFGSGIFGDYRHRYVRGLLLPLKTQVRVFWAGLLPGTGDATHGTWETVPQGRFTVSDPQFHDTVDGDTVTVTGYDAASDIASALWQAPFVVHSGTNVATALTTLLTNRLPGLVVRAPSTSHTTPQLVFTPGYQQTNNPWLDATNLAASAGWVLYIDRDGAAVAEPAPDPSTNDSPVWEYHDDGSAMSFVNTASAADLVNTVVVYAENSGNKPVTSTTQTLDGAFGVNTLGRVVAREYRSSTIKTQAQADNAGIALLRLWSTLTETVAIESFPVPHADAGDYVTLFSENLQFDDDGFGTEKVVFNLSSDMASSQVTVSRRFG